MVVLAGHQLLETGQLVHGYYYIVILTLIV